MIVLITVPQDAPPVLLNLLILRPGANQVGLHSNYVDPYGHPVLNTDHSTWQDWDAWGKWGAQSPPDLPPNVARPTGYSYPVTPGRSTQTCCTSLSGTTISFKTPYGVFLVILWPSRQTHETGQILTAPFPV